MLYWLRLLALISLLLFTTSLTANGLFPIGNSQLKGIDDNVEPLDPEQAFLINPPIFDGKDITIGFTITKGYYLYRDKFKVNLLDINGFAAGSLVTPAGIEKQDPAFGKVEVIHDQANIKLPLTRTNNASASFLMDVTWQGCFEQLKVCYPPQRKGFMVTAPAISAGQTMNVDDVIFNEAALPDDSSATAERSVSSASPIPSAPILASNPDMPEQNRIANILADGKVLWIILSFFGFGLLLSFTPCVFPMIPILSGIIVGQKELTTHKAFLLSLTYVLAMAFTYTLVGVLAGLFGGNLQATFQSPWIISVFSLIFGLLALSMFGFYDLQIPSSWQTRLNHISQRQSGGNLIGVAVMGVLSALIVGPCVAAPLAGALMYIGQTGNAVLGGIALFSLSLGMGMPLLLIGTSAGQWLPRAGAWMNVVKIVFGVLLLAVAIYLLERIMPATVTMLLWGLLLITSAVYMGAVTPLSDKASGWKKLWKGVAIVLSIQGALVLTGAALGGNDVINPLRGLSLSGANTSQASLFQRVSSLEQLNQAIAGTNGKPVMLDVYADWCISCKEMEKYTFPDAMVQAEWSKVVALQIDVTANSPEHKAFLKHFKLIGPPAILFFDKNGVEHPEWRQVGFIPAPQFASHLQKLTR